MQWKIKRLSAAHDCRKFRCGEYPLDNFLKRHALENDRRGLGTTYAAVEEETERVLGYVTLCTNAVHFAHVPQEGLPRYPVPTLLIARLAVDRSVQRGGIGTRLMLTALDLAVKIADRVGVYAVTIDAMTPAAKEWYQTRFGFTELLDDPQHLFATIADLKATGIGGTNERIGDMR